MKLYIAPASREEAIWLSSRLRQEDRQEIETATGKLSEEIIPQAFDLSTECYTIRFNEDHDPVAIFGVSSANYDYGVPWLVATPTVVRGSIALLREAPKWLNAWARRFPAGLVNIVDPRNRLHVRWLDAAGFTLHSSKPVVINSHPFIFFTYRSNSSV